MGASICRLLSDVARKRNCGVDVEVVHLGPRIDNWALGMGFWSIVSVLELVMAMLLTVIFDNLVELLQHNVECLKPLGLRYETDSYVGVAFLMGNSSFCRPR